MSMRAAHSKSSSCDGNFFCIADLFHGVLFSAVQMPASQVNAYYVSRTVHRRLALAARPLSPATMLWLNAFTVALLLRRFVRFLRAQDPSLNRCGSAATNAMRSSRRDARWVLGIRVDQPSAFCHFFCFCLLRLPSLRRPSMNFPAGIIQPPFFSAHYPSTWNYAALGSVMGHEVSGPGDSGNGGCRGRDCAELNWHS